MEVGKWRHGPFPSLIPCHFSLFLPPRSLVPGQLCWDWNFGILLGKTVIRSGHALLFAVFLRSWNVSLHQLNSEKIMVQFCYLRLFKHWICFLFSVATWWRGWTWIEKGNGWVNPFLVLIICQQNHQTLRLSAAWWIFCDGFFITQQDNLVNVSGH